MHVSLLQHGLTGSLPSTRDVFYSKMRSSKTNYVELDQSSCCQFLWLFKLLHTHMHMVQFRCFKQMMTSVWRGLGCLDVSSLAYNSLHVLVMVRRCCSAGSLRLCWDKGEMSGAWTVWTFWLTAGRSLFLLPVISLLIFLFLLSSPHFHLISLTFILNLCLFRSFCFPLYSSIFRFLAYSAGLN